MLGSGAGRQPDVVIAAMQKNLEALGFIMSPLLMERVRTLGDDALADFYRNLINDLKQMVGAHRVFEPMYPDFPAQVREMPEHRLYLNAIIHYFTNRRPLFPKTDRPELDEPVELRVVDLGGLEEFEAIFVQLAGAKTSLSKQDKEDMTWFVCQYGDDIMRLIPKDIPSRENLSVLGAALLRHAPEAAALLKNHIKTVTDVLRLAVALSDGDVSLATHVRFISFKRSMRRTLLSWMEHCSSQAEDMARWKGRWLRLGERLHPGEHAGDFPRTCAAFSALRNGGRIITTNSRIERCLEENDPMGVLELTGERPGDFARRLDHLLRISENAEPVLQAFRDRAGLVSTPVLLQMLAHFRQRDNMPDLRIFFPKGDVGKLYAVPNDLAALAKGAASEAAFICETALIQRFSKLPPLGRCRLDGKLAKFMVPLAQRSASKSLRTLARGSRLPLPEMNVLRFFIWWRNGHSRTDIDLSAALFDADQRHVDQLAYYNLKNFGGCHSGDIVDAPEGAAEFIDVEVSKLLERKVRYIVMIISSFTAQPYCDLPECFAGWMARKEAGSGEIFEPRTVVDKLDVASNTRISIPAVFDLISKEVIWADLALTRHPAYSNNVLNNLSSISIMLRSLTSLAKPDMHTLFSLHARARGTLANEGNADTTFDIDKGITPFDVDRIRAEFL